MVFDDRRALLRTVSDWAQFQASARFIAEGGGRFAFDVLAVAGDRLVLERVHWTIDERPDREVDIELLAVDEVDADGRITAVVYFDPDDRAAAFLELMQRYRSGEGSGSVETLSLLESLNATLRERDREALAALFADGFVVEDHRYAGLGRIRGRDDYLASVDSMIELAADVSTEVIAVGALDPGAVAMTFRTIGHDDGGAFETVRTALWMVEDGHFTRVEFFEPDELSTAAARLAELRRAASPVAPNAATRTADRALTRSTSRDWEAVAATLSPELVYEDRRSMVQTVLGRDELVTTLQFVGARPGIRCERETVATAATGSRCKHCIGVFHPQAKRWTSNA